MLDDLKVLKNVLTSVAEPHHFYAALAPGKNFDTVPASAPTLLYSIACQLFESKLKLS
jgi:hypothetical protein